MSTKIDSLKEKRDKLRKSIDVEDSLMKSFYGGRVGFKSGVAKRKHESRIEREMNIRRELDILEEKIKRLENPIIRSKSKEQNPNEWKIGDTAYGPLGAKLEVIKINTKTVTVKYAGGFKETIKPHLLTKPN